VFKTTLLILTASAIAAAQTTWKGLKFGMSEADVRKEYQGSLEKKLVENGAYELFDRDQKLLKWPATAGLYFEKSGKLSLIEVFMNDPFAAESGTLATGSSFAVMSVVTDGLVEKYGKWISEDGECQLTIHHVVYNPRKIFTCKKLWKSDGQTISMYWSVENQRLSFLALTYKPLPSDL
jgi:hypothetical protein